MTLVAIHQPNFLPWLGYFDKIRQADVFVVLDSVQLPKTGGTWANRVKLLVSGAPAWVTVPIVRGFHGTRTIADTEIDNRSPWRPKLLKTLDLNYRRAPHFNEVFPWLADLVADTADKIADFNIRGIQAITKALHIDSTKLVMASSINVDGKATALLVSMVRAVGGDAYLAGGGATGYQDDAMFSEAGLELRFQDFQHPVYAQFNSTEFVPGLSIVDALMNCGFEGTSDLLNKGRSG
jgi:WbqC-like protein family